MSDSTTDARIEFWLTELRLPTMKKQYVKVAAEVAKARYNQKLCSRMI